jgi:hypothetical protein
MSVGLHLQAHVSMLYQKRPQFFGRPELTDCNAEGFEGTSEHIILKIPRADPCQPCAKRTGGPP